LRKVAENASSRGARQPRLRADAVLRLPAPRPNDPPNTDFSGFNFWLSKLEQFGGDYRRAEMVKAFISSDEYRYLTP
jgi:hypothetical protein